MEQRIRFTRANLRQEAKKLGSLAGPVLIAQWLQTFIVVIDTMMSGHYSATDLSAVAIGGSIWFPIYLMAMGVISALTPVVAHFHGANKPKEIVNATYQCFFLVLILCPVLMCSMFFFEPILAFIQADSEVQPIAVGYLKGIFIGLPPLLFASLLRCYSDGVSMTRPAVIGSLIGLIVNVPLNYVLIYGKFGFPEMGGEGCGWASAISFYVTFLYMLFVVFQKQYREFYLFEQFYKWYWPEFKHLLIVGLPIGLTFFIEYSMFGVIALFLAKLGSTVVAAHQVVLNITAVVFMIPLSLGMALTIRVGFLLGSNDPQQARFSVIFGVGVAALYSVFAAVMLYSLRFYVPLLYTDEAEVIALCAILLGYAAAFQIADPLQAIAAGALRGYKDTKSVLVIVMIAFWCVGLPLGYVLGLTDILGAARSAEGFWMGLAVGLFFAAVLLGGRLRFVVRRFCKV